LAEKKTEAQSLASKLTEISLKLPYLGKTERNSYQDYSYVSIDDFYDKVATVAMQNGMTWSMKEASVRPDGDRWAFTYGFTLHCDGMPDYPDIDRVTVIHPWQGAQTSGSARSYAEKIFMRSLFKVRTGEPDADSTDQRQSAARGDAQGHTVGTKVATLDETWGVGDPEPLPAREDFTEVVSEYKDGYPILQAPKLADLAVYPYELATRCFETFIDLCADSDELTRFWTDNEKILNVMKARAQTDYARIVAAFKTQRTTLEQKGK